MSRIVQTSKSKNFISSSNDSLNKKAFGQTNTSQSMKTESYEYFSQKITSNNNITESSNNNINQNSNSINSQTNYIPKKRVLTGMNAQIEGQINTSGLKCTCKRLNENMQKLNSKCTCKQTSAKLSTGGKFRNQHFEEEKESNKIIQGNSGYQSSQQQRIISSSRYVSSNSNLNQKSNTYQAGEGHPGQRFDTTSKIVQKRITTYVPSNKMSEEMRYNKTTHIIEGRKTDVDQQDTVHNYSYYDSNKKSINNISQTYKNANVRNLTKITNININSTNINRNIYRSYSYDNRENWRRRCVGQNNESLQILATEKPELIAQCVQDMQVLQEPKPVQILMPIPRNEIDYALGLEIYGGRDKNKKKKLSEEEEMALRNAERLKAQMAICPESIDTLNISKAYSTIIPQFGNLQIENYNIFCDRSKVDGASVDARGDQRRQRKALSVERSSGFGLEKSIRKREVGPLYIENEDMKICVNRNFNRVNQKVLTTKMNVQGIYRPSWNEANEAIKTTKMNIDSAYDRKGEEEYYDEYEDENAKEIHDESGEKEEEEEEGEGDEEEKEKKDEEEEKKKKKKKRRN